MENNRKINLLVTSSLLTKSAVCFSGFLYFLCFPSFNHGQLAWGTFVPFLLAVPSLPKKAALSYSFLAGGLAGLGTLYWIYPTCRWGGVNPVVSLFALGGLAAHGALFWLLFGASVWLFFRRPLWQFPFWAAASWTVLEWLRGNLFSGFPWLPLSCSQWQVPTHLPLAEIGGGYAVSFLIMLFNGTIAVALKGVWGREKRWLACVPSLAALIGLTVWSIFLWRTPLPAVGPPVDVAVVQGNIDQYKKWDAAYENEIVRSYSALTREAGLTHPALILWPETAVPGWIPNDARYTQWIQKLAQENQTHLLTGAVTRQENRDYNAAFLFSPAGKIIAHYRKMHLVPFGEYVPLRALLAPFVSVLNDLGSFDQGREATVITIPGARLGVNICFEGLFPTLVTRFTNNGAQVLINITNDGWYRHTAAPEQHFSSSVIRAVENRRWIVRAANTGYSGFISPKGKITSRTRLLEPAVLRDSVEPLNVLTFYARHGDLFIVLCALLLAFGFWRRGKNFVEVIPQSLL
ncbi:MAG: apolipoprotein N-acyltransferase [Elusimicrobia bacterium]|nr:apolipoprotein N-acyltransferase [Elusimicrobiota bacterium]